MAWHWKARQRSRSHPARATPSSWCSICHRNSQTARNEITTIAGKTSQEHSNSSEATPYIPVGRRSNNKIKELCYAYTFRQDGDLAFAGTRHADRRRACRSRTGIFAGDRLHPQASRGTAAGLRYPGESELRVRSPPSGGTE